MGALTLKPLAFRFRPWELTSVQVFNYVEGHGELIFHLRGGKVMKITATGWLQDRTRFCYDGFRRQRLVTPMANGQVVTWATAVTLWLEILTSNCYFSFRVDPLASHLSWLFRTYSLLADGRGRLAWVAVDTNYTPATLYHGAFGLPAVEHATLALPALLPYEQDLVLLGPSNSLPSWLLSATAFHLLVQHHHTYKCGGVARVGDNFARNSTNALFQVSPLQGLLSPW